MKGHFDKNLEELIESKNKTIDEISKFLKIPKSSVKDLLNNRFDDFSILSLKDISNRLSEFFDEEINFIKTEEKVITVEKKKKRKTPILLIMIILIIFSSTYIFFISKDVLYYRNILKDNTINLTIENKNNDYVLINGNKLDGNNTTTIPLTKDGKVVINNNKGTTIVKTPNSEYEIKLEDFEVIFENGKN